MLSSRNNSRRVSLYTSILLCILFLGGCSKQDRSDPTIARTIKVLRDQAENLDSSEYDHSRSYLAPALRGAIPVLESKGAGALPFLLTATFSRGLNVPHNVSGWTYCFCWLEVGDTVRGFYVRTEAEPDLDLYPTLNKEPQVPDTAWMILAGPVVLGEKERTTVPAPLAPRAIALDARVLAGKKLMAGLILADGRKTAPIEAYFRDEVPATHGTGGRGKGGIPRSSGENGRP